MYIPVYLSISLSLSLSLTHLLFHRSGVIREAQAQAARVFGADHTWFLVNGCSVGIHAAVMAVARWAHEGGEEGRCLLSCCDMAAARKAHSGNATFDAA